MIEECVAGEAFVFPGVVFGNLLGTRVVENSVDDLVLEFRELGELVL